MEWNAIDPFRLNSPTMKPVVTLCALVHTPPWELTHRCSINHWAWGKLPTSWVAQYLRLHPALISHPHRPLPDITDTFMADGRRMTTHFGSHFPPPGGHAYRGGCTPTTVVHLSHGFLACGGPKTMCRNLFCFTSGFPGNTSVASWKVITHGTQSSLCKRRQNWWFGSA